MHKGNTYAGLLGPASLWILSCFVALSLFYNKAQAQAERLPITELLVGSKKVAAEVAATDQSRSFGLMYRASLPPSTGMLFVFENVGQPCFWMKNTPLPLSIAFIDPHGVIVNLADMQPHSRDSHCPHGPILYALEMEQGWFASKGIGPGTHVSNLPRP